jgi:hypothetical protein
VLFEIPDREPFARPAESATWVAPLYGGLDHEVMGAPEGTPVTLRGRLRTNTREPIHPTEVQCVHLAATGWS